MQEPRDYILRACNHDRFCAQLALLVSPSRGLLVRACTWGWAGIGIGIGIIVPTQTQPAMELLAVLAARRHILSTSLASWPYPYAPSDEKFFCIFAHACHPILASIYQLCQWTSKCT